MKDKKILTLILVNIFFLVATIVTDILYIKLGNAYVYKTIASATFVLCSLTNLILIKAFKYDHNKKFVLFLFLGQIFAFGGDILLIDYFVIGATSFAIGHIFYFISYCCLKPFKWLDLAFIGGAIAISMIIIFATGINLGKNLPLIIGYAIVISFMLGKSATLFMNDVKVGGIIFTGSLMFYLSDMFLMFRMFGGMSKIGSVLCLSFYYPAEFILASSIFTVYLVTKRRKTND